MKLLGVPALPYKSTELVGDLIGDATLELIDDWPNVRDACKYMVFDTTSANTGNKTLHPTNIYKQRNFNGSFRCLGPFSKYKIDHHCSMKR